MSYSFHGAKLKLKRANKHIMELNAVLNAFLESHFDNVSFKEDAYGWHHLQLGGVSIPEDVPLIIGDAIHNLRSALDFMLCAALHATGGGY